MLNLNKSLINKNLHMFSYFSKIILCTSIYSNIVTPFISSMIYDSSSLLKGVSFFLNNNFIKNYYLKKIQDIVVIKTLVQYKIFFSKYFFIGLGFKMFTYLKKLFIWVGLTHYTLIKIPKGIFIYSKKKRVYILSKNKLVLHKFLIFIRAVKKRDIYKGKGLLEVKTYKGFTIMKTGKKKQY